MDMNQQNNRYRTADLYYAAYLCVAGVSLIEVKKEVEGRDKRVYFYFEHTDALKDLKRDYFNRKGKVAALQYADEVRSMKQQTHEAMAADGP
jgi:hypothetical protein